MALYRFEVKTIGRGDGRSAVACAAYRSGEALYDERLEKRFDYSSRGRKQEIEASWIDAPEGAPGWARERGRLWNEVERAERRKDSQVSREVVITIPRELSGVQARELVEGFVRERFVERGMVADVAIHRKPGPGGKGAGGDLHAHVMLTTRSMGPDGFGTKEREWNRKGELVGWREACLGRPRQPGAPQGREPREDRPSQPPRARDRARAAGQGGTGGAGNGGAGRQDPRPPYQ